MFFGTPQENRPTKWISHEAGKAIEIRVRSRALQQGKPFCRVIIASGLGRLWSDLSGCG
jgi:hypothetical protein